MTTTEKGFDVVGFIIEFEGGDPTEEEVIEGFQHLIDTGQAWQLQGSYGRTAVALIEAGLCSDPRQAQAKPEPKPEKVGTHCECGASYGYIERLNAWGYLCAR